VCTWQPLWFLTCIFQVHADAFGTQPMTQVSYSTGQQLLCHAASCLMLLAT
jgi:hypothetical protein